MRPNANTGTNTQNNMHVIEDSFWLAPLLGTVKRKKILVLWQTPRQYIFRQYIIIRARNVFLRTSKRQVTYEIASRTSQHLTVIRNPHSHKDTGQSYIWTALICAKNKCNLLCINLSPIRQRHNCQITSKCLCRRKGNRYIACASSSHSTKMWKIHTSSWHFALGSKASVTFRSWME